MGLTTERKIFLGLLGIAGVSVVIDRAVLGPSEAGAATLTAEQINVMPEEPILASLTDPIKQTVAQIFNDRLGKVGPGNGSNMQMGDIQKMFSPVVEQAPEAHNTTAVLDEATSTIQSVPGTPVKGAGKGLPALSAAMPARSGESGAILDGYLYRVGETTASGYRLIRVEPRKVLVSNNGRETWISLPVFTD